jgi:hypothetical protein
MFWGSGPRNALPGIPRTKFRIVVENSRTHDTVCELYPKQLKGDTGLTFLACSFDYWFGRNFGDCREYRTLSLIGQAMFVPRFLRWLRRPRSSHSVTDDG